MAVPSYFVFSWFHCNSQREGLLLVDEPLCVTMSMSQPIEYTLRVRKQYA